MSDARKEDGAAAGSEDAVQAAPPKIAVMTSGGDAAGMNAAVRSVVKMAIFRKCHAYVIREGWEGLVRGNDDANDTETEAESAKTSSAAAEPSSSKSSAGAALNPAHSRQRYPNVPAINDSSAVSSGQTFVPTYGEGELLREGVSEASELGLKGRYIIRVGWDDVRGWMDQVSRAGTGSASARAESHTLTLSMNLFHTH